MRIQAHHNVNSLRARSSSNQTPEQKRALLAMYVRDKFMKPLTRECPIETFTDKSASSFLTFVRRDQVPAEVLRPRGSFLAYFRKRISPIEKKFPAMACSCSFSAGGVVVADDEGATHVGFLLVVHFDDRQLNQSILNELKTKLSAYYDREVAPRLHAEGRGSIFPYWDT